MTTFHNICIREELYYFGKSNGEHHNTNITTSNENQIEKYCTIREIDTIQEQTTLKSLIDC